MIARASGLLLGIGLLSQLGSSADVAYLLETKDLIVPGELRVDEPFSIEFRDREWTAMGIERPTYDGGYCESCGEIHTVDKNSFCLDDDLWPRTRELLRSSECKCRGRRFFTGPIEFVW
jgi:hypothetical protein